jgi:hypothetical protein
VQRILVWIQFLLRFNFVQYSEPLFLCGTFDGVATNVLQLAEVADYGSLNFRLKLALQLQNKL